MRKFKDKTLIGSRPVNAKCGKYYVNECKKKCRNTLKHFIEMTVAVTLSEVGCRT
uniref:Uncharacterized protein n=1 Tax=Anguilla anguilla TaxID=7936 RepID=A0A0E9PQ25_ANGAN